MILKNISVIHRIGGIHGNKEMSVLNKEDDQFLTDYLLLHKKQKSVLKGIC